MVTTALLAVIVLFSLYCFADPAKLQKYMFHPYSINKFGEHYRFLSHAFIHGGLMHLGLNVFCLYIFGYAIEESYYRFENGQSIGLYVTLFCDNFNDPEQVQRGIKLAKVAYLGLFTGGIYAASITEYFRNRNNPYYSSLGASGAIEAIIFSYIIIKPADKLYLFTIPMPAWLLGILFLGGSYYMSKRKTGDPEADRIGHEAHFWGAIFGIIYTIILKPSLFVGFFEAIF
jgi:membrane associated rhomboid family serine protease